MSFATRAIVGIAVLKLAWMLLALTLGRPSLTAPRVGLAFGVPPTAVLTLAFGVTGGLLLWASAERSRAWWLGGTLLLIALPFADAVLVRRDLMGNEGWLAPALAVDAFLPFFWWSFLAMFPRTDTGEADPYASWGVRLAAIGGVLIAGASIATVVPSVATAWPDGQPDVLSRRGAPYIFFVIGLTALGLPYLWLKSRRAPPAEARRVRMFAAGVIGGGGPVLVDILLSAVSSGYERLASQPEIVSIRLPVLFGALVFMPLATAYSVLVDRVVDVRVVLRAAAQYALARYTLFAVVSLPFGLLAAYAYDHRHEPLTAMFSGQRVVLSLMLVGIGAAALRQRRLWLTALDRRFFRDRADATELMATLAEHARASTSDVELSRFVRTDVMNALYLEQATLLVVDVSRAAFVDLEERVSSLASASNLAGLLLGDSRPFDVATAAENPVLARLPTHERRWLSDGAFHVLVPIRKSPTSLAAIFAVGAKRSGLAYTRTDHRELTSVAAAVGMALENHRLKSSPSSDDDEPAEECTTCGTVLPPGTEACPCGGTTQRAPVPLMLRAAFKFNQRLGAGGMGVVYRATDLSLRRGVAIKTLPRLSPTRADRLRAEAQAMARLAHGNLATIHGVETWRGTPLLVVELLDGGTLAHKLAQGPLPLHAVLDLGMTLSDVLQHIHAAGTVHCDVKPSNIGFTRSDTLKLLDFGLAQVLGEPEEPDGELLRTWALSQTSTAVSRTRALSGRIAGTPLYMSPEALAGEPPTPAFDLWSAAVVLFEAIAGHHPFAGGTPDEALGRIRRGECLGLPSLRTQVPGAVVDTLERCLAPRSVTRPRSAAELRSVLIPLR